MKQLGLDGGAGQETPEEQIDRLRHELMVYKVLLTTGMLHAAWRIQRLPPEQIGAWCKGYMQTIMDTANMVGSFGEDIETEPEMHARILAVNAVCKELHLRPAFTEAELVD